MRKGDDNSQRYRIHEVIVYGEKEPFEAFTSRFSTEDGVTRASDSSSMKIVLAEIARIKRNAESSKFDLFKNAPAVERALQKRDLEAGKQRFRGKITGRDFQDHGISFVAGTPGRVRFPDNWPGNERRWANRRISVL